MILPPVIQSNLGLIKQLCQSHFVDKLELFGSATTVNFNENSDLDFIVSFKELEPGEYFDNYFRFIDELENLLGRKIDLITKKSISNPYFIRSIERTKTPIYD